MLVSRWLVTACRECEQHGADQSTQRGVLLGVGDQSPRKNYGSHIDASHSRQPLVKGERLVRYEVNAVMPTDDAAAAYQSSKCVCW